MEKFNFKVSQTDAIFVRCGLSEEELHTLSKELLEYYEKSLIEENCFEEVNGVDTFGFCFSHGELAQKAAEIVNKKLTPEIGFIIGMLVSDLVASTPKIVFRLVDLGKIKKH